MADDLFARAALPLPPRPLSKLRVGLIQLEAGESNDLGPLFSFFRDETAEVRGRPREYVAAELAHARLYSGIGERRINLPIETLDDRRRRALGRPEAQESLHRVARDDI